ncbi:MAG: 30S ribosome-binding factor RbfA [Candidatus Colwellbacteria bacterium]|nr:30S ribosome-binding factor RbfA [Candidatus Colwellbacteria bacterium]
MESRRLLKIESLIQKELGEIVERNLEHPTGSLVTLTDVKVAPDLSEAKVGVSVIPKEAAAETLEKLGRSHWEAEKLLRERLKFRPVPRLEFELDEGPEKAARIEKLLLEEEKE